METEDDVRWTTLRVVPAAMKMGRHRCGERIGGNYFDLEINRKTKHLHSSKRPWSAHGKYRGAFEQALSRSNGCSHSRGHS